MSDSTALKVMERGTYLFTKKGQLNTLWQILADEFYPERADFIRVRYEGAEYVERMYESVPAQYRRDLAGAMGAILRPRGKMWFSPRPREEWRQTDRARLWLDFAKKQLRGLLYSNRSGFQHAMSHGDHDFVSFGNRVLGITEGPDRVCPHFELFHLRDCAWAQDRYLNVNELHRKIKMPAVMAADKYGEDKLSPAQKKLLTGHANPFENIRLRHVVMPASSGAVGKAKRRDKPFVAMLINEDNSEIMAEGSYTLFPYRVARWMSGDVDGAASAYAYSPAAMIGLVDARLLQQQARVILEAGERVIDPPMIAMREAVLGGVNTFSGSVNWIDSDYDERTGAALRPLETKANIPIGLEMKTDARNVLLAAWYLNKLNLPSDKEMTAYETSQRIAEYIRSAGPIFEPFEVDNAAVLDVVFDMSIRNGWLGDLRDIPPELRGAEIDFEFDTPVQQAFDRQQVAMAQETIEFLSNTAKSTGKSEVFDNVDFDDLTRTTIKRIGGDASWMVPMERRDQARQAREQAAQQQQMMQQADAGIDNAHKVADLAPKLPPALQAVQQMQQQAQDAGVAEPQGGSQTGGAEEYPAYPRDPDEAAQALEAA